MDKYLIRRFLHADATDKANEIAAKGYEIVFVNFPSGGHVFITFKRVPQPGRPKKEKPKAKKKKKAK